MNQQKRSPPFKIRTACLCIAGTPDRVGWKRSHRHTMYNRHSSQSRHSGKHNYVYVKAVDKQLYQRRTTRLRVVFCVCLLSDCMCIVPVTNVTQNYRRQLDRQHTLPFLALSKVFLIKLLARSSSIAAAISGLCSPLYHTNSSSPGPIGCYGEERENQRQSQAVLLGKRREKQALSQRAWISCLLEQDCNHVRNIVVLPEINKSSRQTFCARAM